MKDLAEVCEGDATTDSFFSFWEEFRKKNIHNYDMV